MTSPTPGIIHRLGRKTTLAYCIFTVVFVVFFLAMFPSGAIRLHPDFSPMDIAGYDYLELLVASAWYKDGLNPYLATHYQDPITVVAAEGIKTFSLLQYNYPPSYLYLFAPLTNISFETGYFLCNVSSFIFLLLSLWLTSRFFPISNAVFFCSILVYIQSSFLAFEIERGQTNSFILLLMVSSFYACLKKDKHIVGGLLMSVAIVLKITPVVLLVFFVIRKKWLYLLSCAIGVTIFLFLTDINYWIMWSSVVMPQALEWWTLKIGSMEHSMIYLMQFFYETTAASLFVSRLAIMTLMAVYVVFAIGAATDRSIPLELGFLMLVMNLSSPWSANYKLIYLPFVFMAPFALLTSPWLFKRPLLVVGPFFIGLFLVVPAVGQQLMTLASLALQPLGSVSQSFFGRLIASAGALLASRKVALGLAIWAIWFVAVFVLAVVHDHRHILLALQWRAGRLWGRFSARPETEH